MQFSKPILVFLAIFVIGQASATLSPKNRGSKKSPEEKPDKKHQVLKGPQKKSVFDRQLVTEQITAQEVIANHGAFFQETDDYNFNGMVLGYVTPWNNHGYDVAKIWGNKFTHISPVWLQIRRKGAKSYEITGTHDIDKQWMVDVKNAGRERKTKVVPRILFEGWTPEDFTALFSDTDEVKSLTETLVKTCKKHKFDGYVVEVWGQVIGSVDPHVLVTLIQTMGSKFLQQSLTFILVIPPNRGNQILFSHQTFDALYDHVSAFSLMTYDYSNPSAPGPNAPIKWVDDSIKSITSDEAKRPKILMGLNFYGNDYYSGQGGGSIVGREYLERLGRKPEIKWNEEFGEHYVEYRDKDGVEHVMFYPTLFSVFSRMDLAYKLNVGLAIWETGQGLDYFYDLL